MKAEDAQKTEVIQFRATPKERALLEKHAKKDGLTVSEYVRATLIMEMATLGGDVEAMKIVFSVIGKAASDSIKKKFSRSLAEEKA